MSQFTLSTNKQLGSKQNKEGIKKKIKKIIQQATVYRHSFIHSFIYRNQVYKVNGPESQSFKRRTYQFPIQSLQYVTNQTLGFTNQILGHQQKGETRLYIPVSLIPKIKSIQQISLKDLMAKIGIVLIIFIYIEGLPEQIVDHLSKRVMLQINRGQSFLLKQYQQHGNISVKRTNKFLNFTIRGTFPVQIYDDIFLSPFQILNLVLSVTMNSTKLIISHNKKQKQGPKQFLSYSNCTEKDKNVQTKYSISFNCMRHPLQVPITYASQCRLGVYDLAEQLLQSYATNVALYSQVIDRFQDFVQKQEQKLNKPKEISQIKDANGKKMKKKIKLSTKFSSPLKQEKKIKTDVSFNFYPPPSRQNDSLTMPQVNNQQKISKKVKYFQYMHFIMPLYKFPGNAWATIFIPMFMLSLLSIFIFLQKSSTIEDQLGSIATFVLGFINLIPCIKDQLPPSQRITFSQIIVYVQSLNCMLSLIDTLTPYYKKRSIFKNPLFVISIIIHVICHLLILTILFLHYFVWEKRYNFKYQATVSSPDNDFKSWSNPYCDQVFLIYNEKIKNENEKLEEKQKRSLIVPWHFPKQQNINEKQN